MATADRDKGDYGEALRLFERLAVYHREDKVANRAAPGNPVYRIDIACLHWLLRDYSTAIAQMHGLAAGILDRSIKYADAAGGMKQGLLLYYMAVTAKIPEESSYALDYLRNRLNRLRAILRKSLIGFWPCPVAEYLLGDVGFDAVMEGVNDRSIKIALPDAEARHELGRRNMLSLALFYDGVKSRTRGDEAHCLTRMRECYSLERHMSEWYLGRYEIQQADKETFDREWL